VLSGLEGGGGHAVVQKGRRGNSDGLHLGQSQQSLHTIAGVGNLVSLRHRLGLGQVSVVNGHNLGAMVGLESRNMHLLAKPSAQNADA
jgi:hypothetical protein